MKAPKIIAISRAWLRKTIRTNRDVDFSLSGPKLKFSFKQDEPIETRTGIDPNDKSPFYESDAATLFKYYHSYANTPEYMSDVLYVDVLPIRTDGFVGLTLNAIRSEDIIVSIEPSSYRTPEKLLNHTNAAVDLFKRMNKLRYLKDKQEWENNTSLRVNYFDSTGKMSCQKARYFDQVGTNITLDWASGALANGWRTIRIDVERPVNGKLCPLRESNLANTLGVAVILYDKALSPIMRVRSDSLGSIPKCGLHSTASGVHEVDPMQPSGVFDYSILERGMVKEIKHEIGLDEHEYQLLPIVFARELPRGGKPQLFFMALAKVDNQRIRDAMASAEEAHEYVATNSAEANAMLSESQPSSDLFTYEGWACLQFAERFVEANESIFQSFSGKES